MARGFGVVVREGGGTRFFLRRGFFSIHFCSEFKYPAWNSLCLTAETKHLHCASTLCDIPAVKAECANSNSAVCVNSPQFFRSVQGEAQMTFKKNAGCCICRGLCSFLAVRERLVFLVWSHCRGLWQAFYLGNRMTVRMGIGNGDLLLGKRL